MILYVYACHVCLSVPTTCQIKSTSCQLGTDYRNRRINPTRRKHSFRAQRVEPTGWGRIEWSAHGHKAKLTRAIAMEMKCVSFVSVRTNNKSVQKKIVRQNVFLLDTFLLSYCASFLAMRNCWSRLTTSRYKMNIRTVLSLYRHCICQISSIVSRCTRWMELVAKSSRLNGTSFARFAFNFRLTICVFWRKVLWAVWNHVKKRPKMLWF